MASSQFLKHFLILFMNLVSRYLKLGKKLPEFSEGNKSISLPYAFKNQLSLEPDLCH